ncbi:MAG: ABC transporter ATP-binding protein [Streptosporangiaceae bacterium]|jgi:ATP-binding cassette subfamily B protein
MTKGSKDNRDAAARLAVWLRPERSRLALFTMLGVISVAFLVAGPVILGHATNIVFAGVVGEHLSAGMTRAQVLAGLRASGQGQLADLYSTVNFTPGTGVNFTLLGRLLGLVALVYALSAVFSWAQGYILAGVVMRTMYRLRQAVEEKLARLPLRYFDSHPHGDILSRVTNDIDNITTSLQEGASQLLSSALTAIGVLSMMFWLSPLLAAVSLVTIPLAIVLTSFIARRSKPLFEAQWDRTGRLNGLVEETHSGHALVQAFGQRQPMIDEFSRQNEQLYEASFHGDFLSSTVLPLVRLIGNMNYVVIAVLGGFQVATGMISLGAVQAFIQYSRQFTTPVSQIAGQLNLLQSGLASARRVLDFLAAPEEAAILGSPAGPAEGDGPDPVLAEQAPAARRVRLRHVFFRYDPDRPLIEDLTLEAAPGQTVAIVGPTGAGKTTVVNLLMRFYEIDSGQILLDGLDYRDLSRDQVRGCFGMVLQDTWLFGGTIRANIAYGKEGAADSEIVAAASAAYVDDFVRTLPDGYATVLDGEASSLSAGQKQLLTIARAFLANPGILILDEATSNVDTRTEVMIQDAMARLRSGRTSFVIAHRLSTVRDADTILVMDAGRVVEQGSHHELLHRGGFYRDLYNSQFTEAPTPLPRELLAAGRQLANVKGVLPKGEGINRHRARPYFKALRKWVDKEDIRNPNSGKLAYLTGTSTSDDPKFTYPKWLVKRFEAETEWRKPAGSAGAKSL